MKILMSIGAYIKTHVIATAVISTVVVGGAVATPIIVNNINDKQDKVETKVEEKHEEEVENLTCEDGYELVDNECIEIKQEIQEEPQENENNNENTTNNNTNTTNNNTNTSTNKPNNKKTNTNTNSSNNKPNNNNNNQTNNTTKPQENKPACNDISCKITESNRIVYYDGKMLFGIKVYQPYGYDVDGWQYNSSLIQSLSKEDRTYILNNYFKKETYCGTNPRTSTNCLTYSSQEEQLDDIIKTSEDEININNNLGIENYTACLNYLKDGTLYGGSSKDEMDEMCHQRDTDKFKWTIEDVQTWLDKNKNLKKLHTNVINETKGYKQAYQATRSLLQQ